MGKKASWNEIPCPFCKEPASASAVKCPHCQSEFPAEQVAGRKKQMKSSVGCGCALLIGGALMLTWCSGQDSAQSVPQAAAPSAKADATAIYRNVMDTVADCDRAGTVFSTRAESGDAITTYRAAEVMLLECLEVPRKIEAIEVPNSLGRDVHEQMTTALKSCSSAYLMRSSGAKSAMQVLDGDSSVSKIADLQKDLEAAGSGTLMCAGSLVAAAMATGATTKDLGMPD